MSEEAARIQREFFAGEADVTFTEEEQLTIVGKKCPYSYVELSLLDQHWPLEVLLDNETALLVAG